MLEAKDISFSYGEKHILKNVSLKIATGGITVLIGPSGTGKTTLLKCLALLEKPQSGQIKVGDEEFQYPWPKDKLFSPPWPLLTTVFQQLFLWPHLTLRENIMLPVRRQNLSDRGHDLDAMIEAFDMKDFIDSFPNEASLGQRQRVALARALMLKPKYLLLDEITSALDVEQIAKILSYLKDLRGKEIGIFIITHLLGFAKHAADHIVFMANGEVAESGTADILKNPKSERLFQFLSVIAAAS